MEALQSCEGGRFDPMDGTVDRVVRIRSTQPQTAACRHLQSLGPPTQIV